MEIRFSVDDNYVKELQSKVAGSKPTQIASEALSLFNWAVEEVKKGKKIVSLDEEHESYKEITTPVLDKAKPQSSTGTSS